MPIILPLPMTRLFGEYERFCRDYQKIAESNIRKKRSDIGRFLEFAFSRGVKAVSNLESRTISEFLCSRNHLCANSMAHLVSNLRSFICYLCMKNLVDASLTGHLPRIRIPRDANIRPVWTIDDQATLLDAVNRTTNHGRRDYAILLLGIRLGMRPSDIRSLRLEHLLWDQMWIEMLQVKTGKPLSVPLPIDVGNAIIDYLRHGRPPTNYREVFLRVQAPYEPLTNIDGIIRKYQRCKSIGPRNYEHGFRSLRHTLATALLTKETPMETISDLLGHASSDTTFLYTKVDVEGLRCVALDPEESGHAL
jgi:integrase